MSGPPDNASAPEQEPGPELGDVRFDSARGVETFDGTAWVPLEQISDIGEEPVFKAGGPGRS